MCTLCSHVTTELSAGLPHFYSSGYSRSSLIESTKDNGRSRKRWRYDFLIYWQVWRTIRTISHHIQALFCHTISQLTAFSVHKFPGSDFSSRAIGLIKRELFTTRVEYCDDVFSCSYLVKAGNKTTPKKLPCTGGGRLGV